MIIYGLPDEQSLIKRYFKTQEQEEVTQS
jgi:hypothetical protein